MTAFARMRPTALQGWNIANVFRAEAKLESHPNLELLSFQLGACLDIVSKQMPLHKVN